MITIVDYGAGNLTSVKRALEFLGVKCQVSADPDIVCTAERIIFPGVGAAGAAMGVMHKKGLDSALKASFRNGTPILGICLGCQIVLTRTEEDDTPGLDLIPGECCKFRFLDESLKVPHIGWNTLRVTGKHALLNHPGSDDEFYFVHSYYPLPDEETMVYGTSEHGTIFPAAIGLDNLFAVQFHAEKSGSAGLQLLKNFSRWNP